MQSPRTRLLLLILLMATSALGTTISWAQDTATKFGVANPKVVTEPSPESILVDKVPDRERSPRRAIEFGELGDNQGNATHGLPLRLPPVNDRAFPHDVVPHRLQGEYSGREETSATTPENQKPIPAIEQPDPSRAIAIPQPVVENQVLHESDIESDESGRQALIPAQMQPADVVQTPAATMTKPRIPSDLLPEALRMRVSPIVQQPPDPQSEHAKQMSPNSSSSAREVPSINGQAERIIQEPGLALPFDAETTSQRVAPTDVSPGLSTSPSMHHPTHDAWHPWWQLQVQTSGLLKDPEKAGVTLHQLMKFALHHSPQLEAARIDDILPQAKQSCGLTDHDACTQSANLLRQIARAYWTVYQFRSEVAIEQRHHDAILAIHKQANFRCNADADRPQLAMIEAILRQRAADAHAARVSLKRAQNELAFLVNVDGWQNDIELMPQDVPCQCDLQFDDATEMKRAATQRPEVLAIMNRLASIASDSSTLLNARITQELQAASERVQFDVKNALSNLRGNRAQMQLETQTAAMATQQLSDVHDFTMHSEPLQVESLLHAQDRLRIAERRFLNAQVQHNIAIFDLRHANGTLFTGH